MLSHVEWSVLLLAREEAKRGRGSDAQPFMLPGEVTRAEWHRSFTLDEIYKLKTPTANIHTLASDFCHKNILEMILL